MLGACSRPDSGAESAAIEYLQAAADRDAGRVWALVTPESHTRLASLHSTLRQTHDLIVRHYPAAVRQEALVAAGVDLLADVADPEALFVHLFTRAGEPAELGTFEKLSTRIRTVEEGDDGRTAVTTWGGDLVTVAQVGDSWRVALSAADDSRLEKLEAMAERNLARVRADVRAVSARRFGAEK